MARHGSGYDDGYGYGFNEVTEYIPHSQPRSGSSDSPYSNASPNEQPRRESASNPRLNNGLSSRVSLVSDQNDAPAPPPDRYFGDYPLSQRRQSQHTGEYAVSPPSRPVSQFEPFQPNMPGTTNGYTVSPPSRPVSQFEPFHSVYQPAPLRTASGNSIAPSSQPISQFEPLRPQPPRRSSLGWYSAGTPDLEEVDISHIRIAEETESPMEDYSAFGPPPASLSPSSGSANRTPSTRSTGSWNLLSPLSDYQPVGTAAPPPTPASPSSARRMSQKFKSFRMGRKMPVHPTITEDGEGVELLQAAGLPGGRFESKPDYDHPPLDIEESVVDLSSFMYAGPEVPHDRDTLEKYKELERNGHLTGGLGSSATTPILRVTGSQLMESSPTDVKRMLTRRGTRMNRRATVKNLAQQQANKTGQVVEIIEEVGEEENPIGIDVSHGYTPDFHSNAIHRTQPLKNVYYPDANWKPYTMRWQYISMLILVSITLGVCQEFLLWKSNRLDSEGNPIGILRFVDPKDMPVRDFFASKYLSTILTVAYGILWQLTDIEVKRLEPYYQLGRPEGALAAESINIDYVTLFDIFRPVVAMWYKHWAVAVSSVASILAVFVIPVLQSFTMELDPKRPDEEDRLIKITIDQNWSRVLSISLYVVSVLGVALLLILHNRNSGLTADVKGIAGVTKMAAKSYILVDFQNSDTLPPKDIHNKLKHHRYTLRGSALAPDDRQLDSKETNKYDTNPFKLDDNPHPFMMRLSSCLGLEAFILFFTGLVPILLFTPASVVSETLPGLTTALAIALKFVLQTLEQDMRMMEPFFVLWKRHAPPKTLTLDYAGMAFGYMPIQALLNGHILLAAMGIGSVLTEVLTVCVSSLGTVSGNSFLNDTFISGQLGKGQETPMSFWISLIIVFVIMAYLMAVVGLVIAYRRKPFLPRQPSTIASVLAYVHQSKMLWHFTSPQDEGATVEESNNKMVKRLEEERKTYGYGWFTGRDGKRHCGVEEEPLMEHYTFGKDHRKGTIVPGEDWEHM